MYFAGNFNITQPSPSSSSSSSPLHEMLMMSESIRTGSKGRFMNTKALAIIATLSAEIYSACFRFFEE